MKKYMICIAAMLLICGLSIPAFADLDSDTVDIFMRYAPGGAARQVSSRPLSNEASIAASDPTLALLHTVRNWDRLRPETRKQLSRYLNVSDWNNNRRSIRSAAAFSDCRDVVPENTSQTMDSAHFRAVYTTNASSSHKVTTSYVTTLLTEAEKSWTKEVTTIGMPSPKMPSDNKLRIYVCDLLGNASGILGRTWTTEVNNSDYTALTFVELDNDYNGMNLTNTTAAEYAGLVFAHEFFHTIQFGINYKDPSYWLLESNATWVEEEVYPDSNDYITQYVRNRLNNLTVPIDHFSFSDVYGYGASIFFRHITENVANVGFIPAMWNTFKNTCILSQSNPGWKTWCNESITETPLVDSTLAAYGSTIQDTYRSFNTANYQKDYVDGSLSNFPNVPVTTITLTNYAGSKSDKLDHLSARFYKISYSTSSTLPILSFTGASGTDWGLTAVLSTPSGAQTVEHKTINSGNYTGQLSGLGTTYTSVVLIVNNTDLYDEAASYTVSILGTASVVLGTPGTTLSNTNVSSMSSNVPAHLAQIITAQSGKLKSLTYKNTGVSSSKTLIWRLYRDSNANGQYDSGTDTIIGTNTTADSSSIAFSIPDAYASVSAGQTYSYLLTVSSQSIQTASRNRNASGAALAMMIACGLAVPLRKKRGAALILLAALVAAPMIYSGCGGGGGGSPTVPVEESLKMSLKPENIVFWDNSSNTVTLSGSEISGPTLTFQ